MVKPCCSEKHVGGFEMRISVCKADEERSGFLVSISGDLGPRGDYADFSIFVEEENGFRRKVDEHLARLTVAWQISSTALVQVVGSPDQDSGADDQDQQGWRRN